MKSSKNLTKTKLVKTKFDKSTSSSFKPNK